MFWISIDKALPAYDEQIVKVKVADFVKDYVTEAWYDHTQWVWYSVEGYCLNDNVYAWKHTYPIKTLTYKERKERMKKWQ